MLSSIETFFSNLMVDQNITTTFTLINGSPVQLAKTIRPIRGEQVELNVRRDEMTGECAVFRIDRRRVTENVDGTPVTTIQASPTPIFEGEIRIFPDVRAALKAAELEIRRRTPRPRRKP